MVKGRKIFSPLPEQVLRGRFPESPLPESPGNMPDLVQGIFKKKNLHQVKTIGDPGIADLLHVGEGRPVNTPLLFVVKHIGTV